MNTNFSLQRVKLLLKADMGELFYFFLAIVVYIVFIFANLIIMNIMDSNEQVIAQRELLFYLIGIVLNFTYICKFINQKVHQKKGLYLTIPANTSEKFTVLLIDSLFMISFYYLLFYFSIHIVSYFVPSIPFIVISQIHEVNNIQFSVIIFIASTFFLSNITFRKYANPIVAGIYAFIILVFGVFSRSILRGIGESNGYVSMIETTPLYSTYEFLTQQYGILLYLATLVVLYISYLKLKEKQIR